jgi:hypothetical protein
MGGSSSKALGKELFAVAAAGDRAQVQTLLAVKANVHQTDDAGCTALSLESCFDGQEWGLFRLNGLLAFFDLEQPWVALRVKLWGRI